MPRKKLQKYKSKPEEHTSATTSPGVTAMLTFCNTGTYTKVEYLLLQKHKNNKNME